MTKLLSALFLSTFATLAILTAAPAQASCTFYESRTTDLSSSSPTSEPLRVPTTISSLLNWEVVAAGHANATTLQLDLTLLLSPASEASQSMTTRYCSQTAASLLAHCARVSVSCDTNGQGEWRHATPHTAFARVTTDEVEAFHLCTSPHVLKTQVLRTVFRWDWRSHQLVMRQRSVMGTFPHVHTAADVPLTAWLVGDESALLVSLSESYPIVLELPADNAHHELAVYPAFTLQMEDLLPSAQHMSGCWDPQLRVGAIILGNAANNTGFMLFALPVAPRLEPLTILVAAQAAPGPTDTRRCLRHMDNFPLHRCHISSTSPVVSDPNRMEGIAAVVVEAQDHPECHPAGEGGTVHFRAEVSVSTRKQWSVTPFVESLTDSPGHHATEANAKAPALCPPRRTAISEITMCSEACAEHVRRWWSSLGSFQSWSCRVMRCTVMELAIRLALYTATLVIGAVLLHKSYA